MFVGDESVYMVFGSALMLARRIHYKLFRAPRGRGQIYTADECDEKYKKGTWDFLETTYELPNFSVAIGYIRYFSKMRKTPQPRILDLGCGTGHFAELLGGETFSRYVGLDLSAEAVRRAQARNLPNAEFCVGDFTTWETNEKFDFIVSTGSICYADDPVEVVKKYKNLLAEEGLFVIALWRYGFNRAIWKNIEKTLKVEESSVVSNRQGQTWDVKVLS